MYVHYVKNIPYSGFCLQGPISVNHQFFCPVVISAIIISAKQTAPNSRDVRNHHNSLDKAEMSTHLKYI